MTWLISGIWWLVATPFLAVEFAASVPVGVLSGGLAYLDRGNPIFEPITIVHGPRYYSHKLDYPLLGVSQWAYFGDEPDPEAVCSRSTEVDENQWAWRWKEMTETSDLRGDETRGR